MNAGANGFDAALCELFAMEISRGVRWLNSAPLSSSSPVPLSPQAAFATAWFGSKQSWCFAICPRRSRWLGRRSSGPRPAGEEFEFELDFRVAKGSPADSRCRRGRRTVTEGQRSASASHRRVVRGHPKLRRGRDSNPASCVGDNFKRHATLHANARKFSSKWFGSLSP